MIKILIIDDDAVKVQKICSALLEITNLEIDNITHVTNIHDGKINMQGSFYDLLILDIALPARLDKEIDSEGGLKLLEELFQRDTYQVPTEIIGITGYTNLYEKSQKIFSDRMLNFIHFDASSDDWITPLQKRVTHLIATKLREKNEPSEHQSHLAIVCALDDPELQSIRNLSWNWETTSISNDMTIYFRGIVRKDDLELVIYAAAASRMGMPAAAVLASKMIALFRPKYIAMTGITAGLPEKTKFGDVVVANPVWDWGNGKWTISDSGSLQFLPSPHQISISPFLIRQFNQLKNNRAVLATIKQGWSGKTPDHELSIRLGPMASGACVLADGLTSEQIRKQHRDLLAIEMETYAVFLAAQDASFPQPTAFSIKSVVDFANGQKDDQFQKYSAYTSAQVLKHMIENLL